MMRISRLKELLSSEEHQQFLKEHIRSDVGKLLFKYSDDPDKRLLIEQIAARQNIRKKLPEFYQSDKFIFPPKLNLEQSSHQAIAELKSSIIEGGEKFADLSSGIGVDFRFLMTKFREGLYLDVNEELVQLAEHNLPQFLPDKTLRFEQEKAENYLLNTSNDFDLIYLDPSRRDIHKKPVYQLEDYQPNVLEIKAMLLKRASKVLVKMSPMISIRDSLKNLPETTEVWVLSYRNECKEVSFLLEGNKNAQAITYRCINIERNTTQLVILKEDYDKSINLGPLKTYLYLPNASVLKGGVQEYVAQEFKLQKLHANSNLYTSQSLASSFPGRIFKVIYADKAYSKSFKGKSLQVISRNFPDSPEKISRRLKLKIKGAKNFLIATKDQFGPIFIEAELIVPSL